MPFLGVDITHEVSGGMITGVIGGFFVIIGAIVGAVTKIMTRNHVTWEDANNTFITQKEGKLKDGFLEERFNKIDKALGIIERDIKEILKNGK